MAGCLPAAVLALGLSLSAVAPAWAAPVELVPQTKLRIAVFQWIAAKGEYNRWDAVSGDYAVSAEGMITIPLIGAFPVAAMSAAELGPALAEKLKVATGLLTAPDATVTVTEYPPVYVIGTVGAAGAYQYRPGLTVLQALALSGGRKNTISTENGGGAEVSALGELQTIRDDILRIIGRIARLQAERSGASEIKTPPELAGSPKGDEIMAQERLVFTTRARELERQLTTLAETKRLFAAEIDVLNEKAAALDRNIKLVDDELTNVKGLVERGVATVSRRSELERAVASLQANRLDQVTATMRARQNVSETTRSELSLRDRRQTDIARELQDAQATLDKMHVKEDVIVKTLVLTGTSILADRSKSVMEPDFVFSIVRQGEGAPEEIAANESTAMRPGDVLKVALSQKAKPKTSDVEVVGSN